MKSLVVYFSRKGYVKKIAQEKAREINADILSLETGERTAGILGFWWCGRFGMHRWGMPLLKNNIDVSSYDKLIICSPIWVFSICAPVRQFALDNAGKVKAADYILVHFSFPMSYPKAIAWLDDTLGIRHGSFESVCCMWGWLARRKTF